MLQGKKILLGVCGSIAAYKSAILVRELVKAGAEVQVILSDSASSFITPLTLSTLSNKPVFSEFFNTNSGEWTSHVELGLWADVFVIAPATANTIAKMANGLCDNLLLATYLSARCPVFVAPAMDLDMYQHPSFLKNMNTLISNGNQIIEATHGELASGLIGQGRMAEPEFITTYISDFFNNLQCLKGKSVLISAGPTQEAIDPVRYISNHSTGKMGYALAEYAAIQGADVTIVSGPVNIKLSHTNIKIVSVLSANEMYNEMQSLVEESDIVIFAAAVADYTTKEKAIEKIKKNEDTLHLELVKNKDIAFELGKNKKPSQLFVGFALETVNEEEYAIAKLQKKNFDFIVLNSLRQDGAGFGHDTNQVIIFGKNNMRKDLPLMTKKEVAKAIFDFIQPK